MKTYPPNFQTAEFHIRGTTPLVLNKHIARLLLRPFICIHPAPSPSVRRRIEAQIRRKT